MTSMLHCWTPTTRPFIHNKNNNLIRINLLPRLVFAASKQLKGTFYKMLILEQMTGIYAACFSNEFSTFSHKLVYMDFKVGEEAPLPSLEDHHTALTQMEAYAANIHKHLNEILDAQTHHRLRESQGKPLFFAKYEN